MKKKLWISLLGMAALGLFNPQIVKAEEGNTFDSILIQEADSDYEGIQTIDSKLISVAPEMYLFPSAGEQHELISSELTKAQEEAQAAFYKPKFQTREGKVTMIVNEAGAQRVRLAWDEMEADFLINDETVLAGEAGLISLDELAIGDTITAYYIQPMAMTMIYPPQFPASVLVKPSEDVNIHAGFFADQIADYEAGLMVTVNPDNPRLNAKGEAVTGPLEYKFLVVYYTDKTADVMFPNNPAEITPSQIIVLDIPIDLDTMKLIRKGADYATPISVDSEDIIKSVKTEFEVQGASISVEGKVLDAPAAYVSEAGFTMVPLRAVSEALGFTVDWNQELKKISIGVATFLTIGEDEYTIGRMVPRSLGQAPELKNDSTFVPVEFFTQVLGVTVAQ